jgi:hypothetical protein
MIPLTAANVASFWSKVEKTEDCWVWSGTTRPDGYGQLGVGSMKDGTRTSALAHRVSYELHLGPLPKRGDRHQKTEWTVDHLCRNRACVRPSHLELVSNKVNILRGISPAAKNAVKTECPAGHQYDETNTYVRRDGNRQCKECCREANRRWLAVRREAS